MRKAILIGFQYKHKQKLPGISVDLYLVYSFLKKLGWTDTEIIVFTDIKKDEQTEILKAALLEKIVDSKILSFIEDLKERNQYIEFKSTNHYNNFNTLFKSSDKTFIYYSGHSKNGNLILPNNSLISLDFFRESLTSKEIFLIMDCCGGGIKLPFVLKDNLYRLENEKAFVKPEIICIASSLVNEKSITTRTGSMFTKNLLNILSIKSLYEISKIGNISVSHPNLKTIFNWFYKDVNIKIIYNENYLLITH